MQIDHWNMVWSVLGSLGKGKLLTCASAIREGFHHVVAYEVDLKDEEQCAAQRSCETSGFIGLLPRSRHCWGLLGKHLI